MSARPGVTVEYLEPVEIEAEPLPDDFAPSRLRRSLLVLAAVVLVVAAAVVLLPGLASLRSRFMGAEFGWLALAVVLQLGSCAAYVVVFRAVFCRRMSWLTSTEIGLSELRGELAPLGRAERVGLALGASESLRRGGLVRGRPDRAAHGGVLPADEPRQRRLPRARRRGARATGVLRADRRALRCSAIVPARGRRCGAIVAGPGGPPAGGACAGTCARCAPGSWRPLSCGRRRAWTEAARGCCGLARAGDRWPAPAGYMLFDVADARRPASPAFGNAAAARSGCCSSPTSSGSSAG